MYFTEFVTIAIAHLIAVASPGPDFAIVLRQSLCHGSRVGVWTALGVGTAILLHVTYCLMGVALILSQSPSLFTVVKLAGAAYLAYLGSQSLRQFIRTWREKRKIGRYSGSEEPAAERQETAQDQVFAEALGAFRIGFLTNGLNPKATLFFLALFTVIISSSTPLVVQAAYGIYLALATFTWFSLLSLVLGRESVRGFFAASAHWIEGFMGLVLLGIALQIVVG